MGSVCGSNKNIRDPKEESHQAKRIRVEVTKNIQNDKIEERNESREKNSYEYIGDNNLSFLREEKKKDAVSFVLYGEEISKVRQTFLVELNNIKDLTLKLTQNQLLLLTEDNQDLLKLLRDKNIDPRNLFDRSQSLNGSIMSLTFTQNVIQNGPGNKEADIQDYLKLKYKKMVQKSFLNSNNEEEKFLNTSFLQEGEFEKRVDDFLRVQNILNPQGIKIHKWDPNQHELIYLDESEKLFHVVQDEQIWENLEKIAILSKIPFNKKFENKSGKKVFSSMNYKIDDLEKKGFKSDIFYAALVEIVNYDNSFNTSLVRRIIYPQNNGIPTSSPKGLYIVKLHINGCKRAVVVQDTKETQMTISCEKYPSILEAALDWVYQDRKNGKITNLIFRLTNWIPETLFVVDIGDALASFDKLKENFNNGYLMIFFDDPLTGALKPILGLEHDKNKNNGRRMIKTVSDGLGGSNFLYEDWETIYQNGRIETLFINWNPTIYSFRKSLHFQVPVKFQVLDSPFYHPKYRFNRYGQVILTNHPHKEQNESRLVLEKHKNIRNINYRIKYYLFHFYNNRLSNLQPALKETEIFESKDEILADIIVFDKNANFENYILAFELIPENPNDYNNLALDAKEVLSLSIYSFAEFEILQIPFKQIDCYSEKKVHFVGLTPSTENPDLVFPMFKYHVNFFGFYEIRIVGNPDYFYGIYIYKGNTSIKQKKYTKYSPFKNQGVCSLNFKLDVGDYIVQIKISDKEEKEEDDYPKNFLEGKTHPVLNQHDLDILFISYSDNLVEEFEKHLPNQNNFASSEIKQKFVVSTIDEGQSLKFKKIMKGMWNFNNNHGTARAKAECYQKFMKNPGFVIVLEELTTLKFILNANKPLNTTHVPYLALSVIKILDGFKFNLILEEKYVAGFKYTSDEITLVPNPHGYLILCYNLSKEWEGSFEFTILSDKKITNIRDNTKLIKLNHEKSVKGEIKEFAGGHYNLANFLFNSVYSFVIESSSSNFNQTFIELIVQETDIPCSLYLFKKIPKVSLFDFDQKELESAEYNPAFLFEVNSFYKELPPGQYFIVPSTLKPVETNVSFKLNVFCSSKFKLNPLPSMSFEQNFILNIPPCKENVIKFNLLKPTKILLIITPQEEQLDARIFIHDKTMDVSIFEKNVSFENNFLHRVFILDKINSTITITTLFNKITSFKVEIFSTIVNSILFQQ
jgi:hypothetical protein